MKATTESFDLNEIKFARLIAPILLDVSGDIMWSAKRQSSYGADDEGQTLSTTLEDIKRNLKKAGHVKFCEAKTALFIGILSQSHSAQSLRFIGLIPHR